MWTEQNWIVYCSVIWSIIRGVAENMKFLFNFFHILFLQNDSSQPETSRGSAAPKSITRFELISALSCSSFIVLLYNGPCTCPDCKPSQSNPVNHLWLRISWTPPFWYPYPRNSRTCLKITDQPEKEKLLNKILMSGRTCPTKCPWIPLLTYW